MINFHGFNPFRFSQRRVTITPSLRLLYSSIVRSDLRLLVDASVVHSGFHSSQFARYAASKSPMLVYASDEWNTKSQRFSLDVEP